MQCARFLPLLALLSPASSTISPGAFHANGALCPGTGASVPSPSADGVSCYLGVGWDAPGVVASSSSTLGLCWSYQTACNNATDAGCVAAGVQQRVHGGGSAAALAALRAQHLGLFSVCNTPLCNAPEADPCALPRIYIPSSYSCAPVGLALSEPLFPWAASVFGAPPLAALSDAPSVLSCFSTLDAGGAPQNRTPTLASNSYAACVTYDYACNAQDNFTAPWPCFNRTAGSISAHRVHAGLSASELLALRYPTGASRVRNFRLCASSSGCNAPGSGCPGATFPELPAYRVTGELVLRAPAGAAAPGVAAFVAAFLSPLGHSLASALAVPFSEVRVGAPAAVFAAPAAAARRRLGAAPAWMISTSAGGGGASAIVGYRVPFSLPLSAVSTSTLPALLDVTARNGAAAVDAALSGGRGARALAANLAHSADFLAVLPYANFSELAGAVGVINVALYDPRPLPEPLTPAAVAGAVVLAVLACAGCCAAARCLRSRAAAKQAEVLTSVEASGVLTLAVAPSPYSPRAARAFGDLCAAGDAAAVRCALAGAPALVASRCAATGRTPLHEAAAAGRAAVVELLLAEGAAVDAVDFNGQAALALTVRGGGAAAGGVAAALLAAGADTEARDAAGRAPLHLAVAARSAALVGALLAAGAAPGALDGEGRTPAQLAQALGAGDIVAALRDAPARPPSPRPAAPSPSASTRHAPRAEAAGRASPQRSEVALFVAGLSAAGVSAEKVAAALARNPALASAANEEGVTALHAATLAGNLPLVAALLAAGAAVDSHDAAGLSPLAVACRNGAAEVASLLLAQHANKAAALAQADNNGLSLLHHAVLSGQPAAVRALLAAGAPRAQRDRGGRTALDVAEMLRTETANTEGASEIGEIVGLLRG